MEGPRPLKREDDWVRGNQLELGRRISQADPDGDAPLWQQLYLGTAAVRLMKGIASREEIAQVMGMVIAQCEIDVQQGARAMLEYDDPSCPACRKLHFDTRVSAAILSRINQLVRSAQTAADEIEQRDQPTPPKVI